MRRRELAYVAGFKRFLIEHVRHRRGEIGGTENLSGCWIGSQGKGMLNSREFCQLALIISSGRWVTGLFGSAIEVFLALVRWAIQSTFRIAPPGRCFCDGPGWDGMGMLVRGLVSDFGRLFCSVGGRPERVDSMRCQRTQRRYHLRRRARRNLTAGDRRLTRRLLLCREPG